jgi:asparagine synthase (glutamine-hydrolysing)
MCGYLVEFGQSSSASEKSWVNSSLSLLDHRGPDSSGFFHRRFDENSVEFGFRRLSIIDLSESANQPFKSSDEKYVAVFNGEIYNYLELRNELSALGYKFRTNSDTEVLISAWQAWGINSLKRFVGMFSFSIIDLETNELNCARDAFGIKPFFYKLTKSKFYASSEVAPLLKVGESANKVNERIAYQYLVNGEYDRSGETFFAGIYSLPPGTHAVVKFDGDKVTAQITKWWDPKIELVKDISYDEAAFKLRELFLKNIDLHLRADVKVAAALSGGLDSSSIVHAIRYLFPTLPIHTYSYIANVERLSEEKWIESVVRSSSATITKIDIADSGLIHEIENLIRAQGEPFGSSSVYAQYKVFEKASQDGVRVMLDGQGADEILGGYHGYPESRILSLLATEGFLSAGRFAKEWSTWPNRQILPLLKSTAMQQLPKGLRIMMKSAILQHRIPAFVKDDARIQYTFEVNQIDDHGSGRSLANRLKYEQSGGALSSLLRHADRNSMAWSVESRVPFLTPEISEFCLSLPENFLVSDTGETKSLFRTAMKGIVPDDIRNRRDKIGFETPESQWFDPRIDFLPSDIDALSILNFIDVDELQLSRRHGTRVNPSASWRLFNLSKWIQVFGVS